jgi:hypothetical protein
LGQNKKDKRPVTTVDIKLAKGVMNYVRLFMPLVGSQIDYHGYELNTDGSYIYDQKILDTSL